MADPIIYVDQSAVRPGRLGELRAAIRELADLVEREEPRLLAYAAYLDEPDGRMTVVHVHRDAASLDRHFEAVGAAFGRFAELVELRRIDVYGTPSAAAGASLRRKAELLGDATVEIHPFETGFLLAAP